jgi:hypothetical protein
VKENPAGWSVQVVRKPLQLWVFGRFFMTAIEKNSNVASNGITLRANSAITKVAVFKLVGQTVSLQFKFSGLS